MIYILSDKTVKSLFIIFCHLKFRKIKVERAKKAELRIHSFDETKETVGMKISRHLHM